MKKLSKLLPALNKKLVIPIISVIAFLVFGTIVAYQVTKEQVTVVQDGEVTTIKTHADTVNDVLKELGIQVEKYDELSPGKNTTITSDMKITFKQANKIIVSTDGQNKEYFSTSDTVGEFFKENNISFTEHDQVSATDQTAIEDGLTIEVKKAFQVTINDGGEKKKVWTTGGTVADLMKKQEIALNELDRLEPKETENLSEQTTIEITRVEKVTDIVEEAVDYAVEKKSDSSLAKGKEKVVSAGEEGLVAKHYEVVLENGKEVSRELVKEEVKKESQKQVVAVGTKVIQNTNTNTVSRGDSAVSKTVMMHATAYNWNCPTCSGSGRTATGYNLKANPSGVVSVDPSVIPLGTKVWVEGYGYAVARDTGGNIKGNRIDIHLPTQAAAERYGTRTVKVKILD
ncbi:G5 and 3D domain-containing protein [Aquibacillus kalidii]|uniref:G5 and 3D domain-containing protein n=1 Tax=Aquibacillus kalidii TaxID=2762597 RepID=UPI0016471C60|nr:G5 and 3D domain-containing protein [Aquibacillus kalidii]